MILLTHIRRHLKLILIVSALCLPILVLTALFINQSLQDIRSAERELTGAAYLRATWHTLSAMYTNEGQASLPLVAAARKYNANLGLQSEYESLVRALDDSPASDATRLKARQFITRIADTSNLTLDPRIDTYYLMNAAVTDLPDIGRHDNAIMHRLAVAATGQAISEQEKADLNTEITLLSLTHSNAGASVASAIRGNPDGKVSGSITPALTQFNAAEEAYLARARILAGRVTAGQTLRPSDVKAMAPLHMQLETATDNLWSAVTDDLERLLKARIGDAQGKLWLQLGIATLVLLAALCVTIYLDLYLQHEHILKLNATLTQSNEELERFAFICSHDLQEPVRMMSAYATFLSETAAGKTDDDAQRYARYIIENARRMEKMIRDILAFSSIGRGEYREEMVDCELAMQRVLAEFAPVIKQTAAKVSYRDLPVIKTNPTLMDILFQNLIGNALKFQNGNRPPEVTVSATRNGSNWLFSVRDNGIGMDPAFSDQVFTLFHRLNRSEDYPGTGIGLSTCRKFIQLCGGDIGFTSRPGEGTVFSFTLPVKE